MLRRACRWRGGWPHLCHRGRPLVAKGYQQPRLGFPEAISAISGPILESGPISRILVCIGEAAGRRRRRSPTSTRPPRGLCTGPSWSNRKRKNKNRSKIRDFSLSSVSLSLSLSLERDQRQRRTLIMQNLAVMHDATHLDNAGEFPCESQLRK
jgi:hypothetical protein